MEVFMNTKTLKKINLFGKVGKIIITILLIAATVLTAICGAAAVYTATLPKDAVEITVTNHAEFKIKDSVFDSVWSALTDSFSGSEDSDPSAMLEGKGKISPAENTELNTKLKFFNQSYSSTTVISEGKEKIIDAKSSPAKYRFSDLVTLLILATLFAAAVAVALLMLQKLFGVLSVCASPFCTDFVSKLRIFGYSLLPVALFASVGETLAVRFLSAGAVSGISVQWGLFVAFAVAMCLVAVFRYGIQLQKESDETL